MANQETWDFVRLHREDDVRRLALSAPRHGEVDVAWALQQIAGWQTARTKLPSWAAIDGIVYPPHLNMEQCSSEQTARYKARLAVRLLAARPTAEVPAPTASIPLVDLTGGFGVDFATMAREIGRDGAVYIERNAQLSSISSGNFAFLNLPQVTVVTGDGVDYLQQMDVPADLIFADPARRDGSGGRIYAMVDCTPDVLSIVDDLLQKARFVILKLSPMLDWHKAVSDLNERAGREVVREVHIVSVKNECKELLLVLADTPTSEAAAPRTGNGPRLFCVNDEDIFATDLHPTPSHPAQTLTLEQLQDSRVPLYLYEPNASLMKAGIFDEIADFYHLTPLSASSHLLIGQGEQAFSGRRFQISAISSMKKAEIKALLGDLKAANVSVRNFPLTAEELRKRLKLRDGGDAYLFGTTLADGTHVVIRCHK